MAEKKKTAETVVRPPETNAKKPAKKAGKTKKTAPAEIVPAIPRKICFIGSECFPFIKTGGLGDVMYALPRALIRQNCDVRVVMPRYECIPEKFRDR